MKLQTRNFPLVVAIGRRMNEARREKITLVRCEMWMRDFFDEGLS